MSREYVSSEDTLLEPGNLESAEFYAKRHVDLPTMQSAVIERLTHFIASLNDLLTQRVIDLSFGDAELVGLRWCWITGCGSASARRYWGKEEVEGLELAK